MHTSTELDLRDLRDMPRALQERITARILITKFALHSPEYTDWLLDDLTNQDVEWLVIDELSAADMCEWARTLHGLWDDAARHLEAQAARVAS